jgi:hypothetical protein
MIADLTIRTRLGAVDLVPFMRRDEGVKDVELCDWERKPAALALHERGWDRERIVHATGLRADDVDAVLSGAEVPEAQKKPIVWGHQQQASVRLRRAAERVLVDGRMVHPDAPHGEMSGYKHWCCRCEPGSTVYSIHCAARRRREAEQRVAA